MTTTALTAAPTLTMQRLPCIGCGRDVVTAAQVDRWPHLARHARGTVAGGRAVCETCSEPSRAEPSRAEPRALRELAASLACNPWNSRALRAQALARLLELDGAVS